jgi:alanine dehydrogenase
VPNLTSNLARTASRALADAALPFINTIADLGLKEALACHPGIGAGTYLYRGRMVHEATAETFGIPAAPLGECLEEKGQS